MQIAFTHNEVNNFNIKVNELEWIASKPCKMKHMQGKWEKLANLISHIVYPHW
jgi:hypothetical protein